MAVVMVNNTVNGKDACERLIFKLLLPVSLFGQELLTAKADKVQRFKAKFKHFHNHTGIYDKDYIIWELAKVTKGWFYFC